jgi:hypothetical protein
MLPGTGDVRPPRSPHIAVPEEGVPATQVDAAAQNDAIRAKASLPPAGVFEALTNALAGARSALSSFLDLVSLETRRLVSSH